ncbi:major capsid protein, partial [Salmonella enterica]|nr:major capsid protein [Salmonella enterica]
PISLPRMNKNATDAFGFVNENGEGALSDVAFDGVPMSMKTFTGAVAISRQSMLSMPNVGALVAEHLIKASRIKLEKLILGNEEVANARAGLVKQLIDAGKVVKCGLTHKDFLVEIAKLTDAG